MTLSAKQLKVFAAIPRDAYATVAAVAPKESPAERQRIIRRLEALNVIDPVRGREKSVRVAARPFPVGLHAILASKPHLLPLLAGARLPILAALAETGSPTSTAELARITQTHPNTVYGALRAFTRRAFVAKSGSEYRLADHVVDLRQVVSDYATHVLQLRLTQYPLVRPILRSRLRLIVESDEPVPDLAPTAHYWFQLHGADILSARHQYALTLAGQRITSAEALEDAKAVGTSPRTMAAITSHMKRRRKTNGT